MRPSQLSAIQNRQQHKSVYARVRFNALSKKKCIKFIMRMCTRVCAREKDIIIRPCKKHIATATKYECVSMRLRVVIAVIKYVFDQRAGGNSLCRPTLKYATEYVTSTRLFTIHSALVSVTFIFRNTEKEKRKLTNTEARRRCIELDHIQFENNDDAKVNALHPMTTGLKNSNKNKMTERGGVV